MNRTLIQVFLGFVLLTLAGCGFQLRGTATVPEHLKTMYIQGIDLQQDLGRELKRGLQGNDVLVLDSYQQGSAILTVLDNTFERRVLSVGSDAKVSEYDLYRSLTYKITDENGQVLSADQKLIAQRDYQFDQDKVLASEQEEAELRKQLNQQLVQSVLRRLTALK